MSDMIQLNVGGTVFATSRDTLSRYEDSMLGKMFNGTWPLTTDPEGRYFIDRDGNMFRHVLNFLRTGRLLIPDEFPELQLLRCEADFYQIVPLVEAVDRENHRRGQLTICNQDYYLDIAWVNIFSYNSGDFKKNVVIVGYLDVIKSLPLDKCILAAIREAKQSQHGFQCKKNDLSEIQCYSEGELCHVLATSLFRGYGDYIYVYIHMNKSYLDDILLAKNCSRISSSSAFHKQIADCTVEFHCCDQWRIPVESLKLLSDLPKL